MVLDNLLDTLHHASTDHHDYDIDNSTSTISLFGKKINTSFETGPDDQTAGELNKMGFDSASNIAKVQELLKSPHDMLTPADEAKLGIDINKRKEDNEVARIMINKILEPLKKQAADTMKILGVVIKDYRLQKNTMKFIEDQVQMLKEMKSRNDVKIEFYKTQKKTTEKAIETGEKLRKAIIVGEKEELEEKTKSLEEKEEAKIWKAFEAGKAYIHAMNPSPKKLEKLDPAIAAQQKEKVHKLEKKLEEEAIQLIDQKKKEAIHVKQKVEKMIGGVAPLDVMNQEMHLDGNAIGFGGKHPLRSQKAEKWMHALKDTIPNSKAWIEGLESLNRFVVKKLKSKSLEKFPLQEKIDKSIGTMAKEGERLGPLVNAMEICKHARHVLAHEEDALKIPELRSKLNLIRGRTDEVIFREDIPGAPKSNNPNKTPIISTGECLRVPGSTFRNGYCIKDRTPPGQSAKESTLLEDLETTEAQCVRYMNNRKLQTHILAFGKPLSSHFNLNGFTEKSLLKAADDEIKCWKDYYQPRQYKALHEIDHNLDGIRSKIKDSNMPKLGGMNYALAQEIGNIAIDVSKYRTMVSTLKTRAEGYYTIMKNTAPSGADEKISADDLELREAYQKDQLAKLKRELNTLEDVEKDLAKAEETAQHATSVDEKEREVCDEICLLKELEKTFGKAERVMRGISSWIPDDGEKVTTCECSGFGEDDFHCDTNIDVPTYAMGKTPLKPVAECNPIIAWSKQQGDKKSDVIQKIRDYYDVHEKVDDLSATTTVLQKRAKGMVTRAGLMIKSIDTVKDLVGTLEDNRERLPLFAEKIIKDLKKMHPEDSKTVESTVFMDTGDSSLSSFFAASVGVSAPAFKRTEKKDNDFL